LVFPQAGWVFSGVTQVNPLGGNAGGDCLTNAIHFFGLLNSVATLSVPLSGAGCATITFSNCWNGANSFVGVYLDGVQIALTDSNPAPSVEIEFTFTYTDGQVLAIKDEGANAVAQVSSLYFRTDAVLPTDSPTTSTPTTSPTGSPTTTSPTSSPTTSSPTSAPTDSPTTTSPTTSPSDSPTESPTMSPTAVCAAFMQIFTVTTSAVDAPGPPPPAGKRSKGMSMGKRKGRGKSSSSRGKNGSSGKGSSASCDYAEAFGNAIAAGFEASSGFPVGTGPLDTVLDSVVASNVGGCPSTATRTASVVLTYKPESTPVDPVALADAARAWQTEAPFPMTIDVCGCTATIELTGTTSGYAEFTGKGTPKSGKCKGGFSPASTPKSPKKSRVRRVSTSSVGTQSTSAAVVTGSTVVVLVVFVAMALIKRRARLPTQPSTNTELAWDCHE
jgi:hypothetical protein